MGDVVKIVGSPAKAKRDHNKMLRDRIEGMPAQPGTPETEKMRRELQDPNYPNGK